MASSIIFFGEFRLDPAKRELWRGDQRVSMQPRAFECLAYLVEHRDRAVGRDELVSAVWGKLEVSYNLLDQMMLRVRRAIGDSGVEQRFIRTIPRFGYSWVAPLGDMPLKGGDALLSPAAISILGDDVASEPRIANVFGETIADSPKFIESSLPVPNESGLGAQVKQAHLVSPSPSPSPSPRGPWILAVLLVLATVLGFTTWHGVRVQTMGPTSLRTSADVARIALVLPVTVDADGENTWMRLGIMDLLAERLRAAGQPVVPSDNVVGLVRGFDASTASKADIDALVARASASLLIDAHTYSSAGRWHVDLRVVGKSTVPIGAQGVGDDVLAAARMAADRLSVTLGLTPPQEGFVPLREQALAKLMQQIRAANFDGRISDARSLLDSADDAQRSLPELRYLEGEIDMAAGRYETARAAFGSVADDVASLDDPILRARALIGLGITYFRRADYVRAGGFFNSAVDLLDNSRDPEAAGILGRALRWRGGARSITDQYEAAQADFALARVALESTGDQVELAILDNSIGALWMEQGRAQEALHYLERAAERSSMLGDRASEMRARSNIARVHYRLLDPAAALAQNDRVAVLESELEATDPRGRVSADTARLQALIANGRLQEADALLRQVLGSASDVDPRYAAMLRFMAAQRATDEGDFGQAGRDVGAALAADWGIFQPREHGLAWRLLLRLQQQDGEQDAARRTVAQAVEWAANLPGAPVARVYAKLVEAEHAAAIGRDDEARVAFDNTLALARDQRTPIDLVDVCTSYADYLIGKGDLAAASVVVGHVDAWATRDFNAAVLQLRLYHALGQETAWRSALDRARRLAGERAVPAELQTVPASIGR